MNPEEARCNVAAEIAAGDELGTIAIAREKNLRPSTVLRWILTGLPARHGNRVRLEALKRGRRWLTSRAALARFFGELPNSISKDASGAGPASKCPGRRKSRSVDEYGTGDAAAILRTKYDF
jgi:hypothetical protein